MATDSRPTFRLYVLGSLAGSRRQELVSLAAFRNCRAVARLRVAESEMNGLRKKIRELRGFIESGHPDFDVASLKDLGGRLFDLTIRGEVRRLFDRATGQAKGFLPLELCVEDYGIAGWPWEYLYDPKERMFVCQEFHPVSRAVFTLVPEQGQGRLRRCPRILFAIGASPDDPYATPSEEMKWLQEVFDAALGKGSVNMDFKQVVDFHQLQLELDRTQYDIFHFYGHARFDARRKEGYLRLDPPKGKASHLYANTLAQTLAQHHIRFVFLNACETARAGPTQDPARSSLAAALVGRGIPAVVATQFSMPAGSAPFLSSVVYNALALGKPTVEALRGGRRAMCYAEGSQDFDWGIPVLYCSDPNLVIFPRGAKRPRPKWARGFEKVVTARNVVRSMAAGAVSGGPTIAVERTARSPHKATARVKVALIDIDSKVGFLPDIAEAANKAQRHYDFRVVYLPIPSGAVRTDLGSGKDEPQMFVPRLEEHLSTTPEDLGVDLVCCLTQHMIAWESKTRIFWNYFSATLDSNENVFVISTYDLREYAEEAKVSFAKATLFLCLGMLVVEDERWGLGFHARTAGCLLDRCDTRDDIVKGLSHMRFDHASCRKKIGEAEQLKAIDALLGVRL